MPKKSIILTLLVFHFYFLISQDCLTFSKSYDKFIKTSDDLNTQTLSFEDKLKFRPKTFSKRIKNYLDERKNFISEKSVKKQVNLYPDWYTIPTVIKSSYEGSISYFENEFKLQEERWYEKFNTNESSQYEYNSETDMVTLTIQPTNTQIDFYNAKSEFIKKNSLVTEFEFFEPNEEFLQLLYSSGYELIQKDDLIKIYNDSKIIIWDFKNKIIIKQLFEEDVLVSTQSSFYKYYDEFDTYLLEQNDKTKMGYFSNGSYYEEYEKTEYSGFTYENCDKKSDDNSRKMIEITDFLVTESDISFTNPNSSEKFDLYVTDMNGKVLKQKRINSNTSNVTISISNLPAGAYIIALKNSNNKFSKKFIKN